MIQQCKIPIIFGVTGHRDLREEDIFELEKKVKEIFINFQKKYAHIDIIVISALAQGADTLVARVAKKLDLKLHIILPYDETLYIQNFSSQEKEEFAILKSYASRVEVDECDFEVQGNECYTKLAQRIVRDVNILLALWDGKDNNKSGGTAEVVRYQREDSSENRYDLVEGDALFILNTPRKENPNIKEPFKITREYIGINMNEEIFEEMLYKIDSFSQEMKLSKDNATGCIEAQMNYFEIKSSKNQAKFKLFSKMIVGFTGIAIASLEIMHALHIDNFILLYAFGLSVAFGIYIVFMKSGKVQNDFVFSRGFAEAIRIQNVWNEEKIDANIAYEYLKNQHHDFAWIKLALKGMIYLDNKSFQPMDEEGKSAENWIHGQLNYFNEAYKKRYEKLEFWEKMEKFFYKSGFFVLILMFVMYSLVSLGVVNHAGGHETKQHKEASAHQPIKHHSIEDKHSLEKVEHHEISFISHIVGFLANWHLLVLISGLLLMVAALIGEKYLKIEGFKEEIYHFRGMKKIFAKALHELTLLQKNNTLSQEQKTQQHKQIVKDLGLKALEENSKWVVLHSSLEVKPSLD
jgi:hypothetical protein